jgi:alpha-beta hydrolase superfamily lysophospholipase
MGKQLDLRIDVSDAAGIGEPAVVAVTVHLPDPAGMLEQPVICFAKPGGGYSRGYYTVDLPGPATGAQAEWHASRGWIFASVDHLGVGDSTVFEDPDVLTYTVVAAANHAAEEEIIGRLRAGTLSDGFPPVDDALRLGIGQSMGGCMTVIQQGRYHCYDGIGVLGYSAVHTTTQMRDGSRGGVPWVPRDVPPSTGVTVGPPMSAEAIAALVAQFGAVDPAAPPALGFGFHYDDVAPEIVRADLDGFPARHGNVPAWGSGTLPLAVAAWCMAPGAIAPEAAAIVSPVLVAMGERDVLADPRGELRAYQSATSVDFYVCPRMGHMHNFAGTREMLWRRIEDWSVWVRTYAQEPRGSA